MARLSPRRNPRGRDTPSRRATRIAFVVIVLFVLAQVVWWILFQERYIGGVIEERLAAWQRDATTATRLLERGGPAVAGELLATHPHLRLADGAFEIDPAARAAFLDEQQGYLRMFAFEGPFFVLVILALLGFIARSLHAERELKRSRQNFLSAITHEFKTPISTLKLLIQTARKRALPPDKQQEYLRRMEGELDRLERTAEQVLAAARLEQARERRAARADAPPLEAADLNDLAARLVARARPGLEARGARLTFAPADAPLPVAVEPDALGVVLNNLLDNAVKYSFDEPKRVRVAVERRGGQALLHVDDWGIGVPDAERERIFEGFYRSGDEMTRRAPGVGLGLHLARRIALAMEAGIENGSNPADDAGRGSRFSVTLPLRPGSAAAPREPGRPADPTPARGAR